MSRISTLNRTIRHAAAGVLVVVLHSPIDAANLPVPSVFPDLTVGITADQASTVVSSHLPWPAPVGHRQPHEVDVPQPDVVSAWEREQHRADEELDRKLIICRGC